MQVNSEVELTEHNQDFCMVCKDGGILVCCDGCEKAVHAACIGYEQTPEVSAAWLLAAACPVGQQACRVRTHNKLAQVQQGHPAER